MVGLALAHGGYAATERYALAIGVWWALALTVGLGLWPLERIPRGAIVSGALLTAFAAFTACSIVWADSAERAFAEFDRVLLLLGVFALGVVAGSARNIGRWTNGIAIGIVAVGLLALASRLFAGFVSENSFFSFFEGGDDRLSYPVDYWNGLAILVGLSFPLLLRAAVASRPAIARGLAVAPLPALASVVYLTSSRGGAATATIGTLCFLAFTSRRIEATGALVTALAGSAAALAVLLARPELVDGPLASAAAHEQGESAAPLIALVCVATGAAWAIGSAFAFRAKLPRPGATARRAAVAGVALLCVAGLVAADPVERFETFQRPPGEFRSGGENFTSEHLFSGSGSGRWQFWETAFDQFETRPLVGRGAGSYEAWWAAKGSLFRFIRDAHSLYLETLGELGVIGLALLLCALGSILVAAFARLRSSAGEQRNTIAALAAILLAFLVAAGIDWMWELTVVSAIAFACAGLLTGAATAAGSELRRPARSGHRDGDRSGSGSPPAASAAGTRRRSIALAFVAAGALVIAAQAIPLLSQTRIGESRAAVERGDGKTALEAALAARRLQPWAASPHLQLALVREQTGDLGRALSSIHKATDNDRGDWRLWLVRARIETKAGAIPDARTSLRRARSLNPRSPLFRSR